MTIYITQKNCPRCGGAVGFESVSKPDGNHYESSDYGYRNVLDRGHLYQTPDCDQVDVLCAVVRLPIKPKLQGVRKS